jgi:hypothetical protein
VEPPEGTFLSVQPGRTDMVRINAARILFTIEAVSLTDGAGQNEKCPPETGSAKIEAGPRSGPGPQE